jgi:methylmalonyl-CoA mutase
VSTGITSVLPPARERYLAEISETVRAYHRRTAEQADRAQRRQHLAHARDAVADPAELTACSRRSS